MEQIEEFVDERQRSWCVHCGRALGTLEVDRDHAPSKGLLVEPYPDNLPCIDVCKSCNRGFSIDEEYLVAFLGCVLAGSTDPTHQPIPRAARILGRSAKLRARIDRAKIEFQTHGGRTICVWTPEVERIRRIVLKNARAHAFFEFGEPMLKEPSHVRFAPLESLTTNQRGEFENIGEGPCWPEVGSRMMTRMATGQDLENGWVIVQDGVYRYTVAQCGTVLVKSVLFEYLAAEVFWG